jgi:hypothetical protein
MTILVANLAPTATEDAVRALFEPYGVVEHVGIIRHPDTGRPAGACLVRMPDPAGVGRAISALEGVAFLGQPIHLSDASPLSVLLPFGLEPEASAAETQSGQPPARDAAVALREDTEGTIRFAKAFAIRYVPAAVIGLAVCALFLPRMPLHRYLFPWGLLPFLITALLCAWAFIACVGMLGMRAQRREARKLVRDLTIDP